MNLTKYVIVMKKLNQLLTIIIGSVMGAFAGRCLYIAWNYKTRPEFYAMQSAPWHTSILVDGAFTLAVLLICIVIKVIIKKTE